MCVCIVWINMRLAFWKMKQHQWYWKVNTYHVTAQFKTTGNKFADCLYLVVAQPLFWMTITTPHIKIYGQLEKWRRSDRFFPLELHADIAGSMSSWSTCFLCSNVSFCILCFSAAEFTLGRPGWCTVKEKGCFQSLNQLWHKRLMQFTSIEWIVTLLYLMWEEWWQGSSHAKWKLSWVCMTDLQGRPLILEAKAEFMCRLTGRRSSSSILWDSEFYFSWVRSWISKWFPLPDYQISKDSKILQCFMDFETCVKCLKMTNPYKSLQIPCGCLMLGNHLWIQCRMFGARPTIWKDGDCSLKGLFL